MISGMIYTYVEETSVGYDTLDLWEGLIAW